MREYLPLKHRSLELSDEYYRCLSKRIKRSKDCPVEECLRIAREYEAALRRQLDELDRLSDSVFATRERRFVREYLQLLDMDVDLLTDARMRKAFGHGRH